MKIQKLYMDIITHPWCGGHFTSIKCLWGVGGQCPRFKSHIYTLRLSYSRISILY